jgi:hypothetical protein
MLNPSYLKYKNLYELNDLAFRTKYEIINSSAVQKILPPYPSFLDRRNTKGGENYNRYCLQANYVAYPNICLDAVLGIVNRGEAEIDLPENMKELIDYATDRGTPLIQIQNKVIEGIFKFGLAGILVEIPENVSIANAIPKLKVFGGDKILDFQHYTNSQGLKKIKFLTLDASRHIYSKKNKGYSYTKIYKVHSLTAEGRYCVAEVLAQSYTTYDPDYPSMSNGVLSITYPSWTSELDFVPFVPISKFDTTFDHGPSFIQDIIDISLQNFRLEANLCWLEANAAASHLVVKGRNLDDISQYPVGAGAVHILNDDTAQEYYVSPSTQGMAEIKQHILDNNALANEMMYNLTNVAANSSGEALKIRISSKMQDLIGLLKNIGYGITLILEDVDKILNQGINKDVVEFRPYLGFANIEEYIGKSETAKEEPSKEQPKEEEDIEETE